MIRELVERDGVSLGEPDEDAERRVHLVWEFNPEIWHERGATRGRTGPFSKSIPEEEADAGAPLVDGEPDGEERRVDAHEEGEREQQPVLLLDGLALAAGGVEQQRARSAGHRDGDPEVAAGECVPHRDHRRRDAAQRARAEEQRAAEAAQVAAVRRGMAQLVPAAALALFSCSAAVQSRHRTMKAPVLEPPS